MLSANDFEDAEKLNYAPHKNATLLRKNQKGNLLRIIGLTISYIHVNIQFNPRKL